MQGTLEVTTDRQHSKINNKKKNTDEKENQNKKKKKEEKNNNRQDNRDITMIIMKITYCFTLSQLFPPTILLRPICHCNYAVGWHLSRAHCRIHTSTLVAQTPVLINLGFLHPPGTTSLNAAQKPRSSRQRLR